MRAGAPRAGLVVAADRFRGSFEMIVAVEKLAAVMFLLFAPEPPDEPLVGRLISQIADTPEIFHGGLSLNGIGFVADQHIAIFFIYKVIYTKYSKHQTTALP